MPIHINLLAECKEAEEEKRKDPVKRGVWIGAFIVFCVLLYYSSIKVEYMVVKSKMEEKKTRWEQMEGPNKQLVSVTQGIRASIGKLEALNNLSTNRFYWAPVLNALQHTVVDDINLTSFKGSINYELIPPVMDKKDPKKVIQPAKSRESITLTLDARDLADPATQNYNKFRAAIENSTFFREKLQEGGLKLAKLLPPTSAEEGNGKQATSFTLECRFPQQVRQ